MSRRDSVQLSLLTAISLFALSLVALFALFPPPIQESPPWGRTLVGALFVLVCVSGKVAVFFPAECSRVFGHGRVKSFSVASLDRRVGEPGVSYFMGIRLVHGHHPPCHLFRAHEFQVSGKTFCAGCIGLLIGALAALIGAVLYFFVSWPIDKSSYALLIAPGILGILIALLQFHALNVRFRVVRVVINAFFVVANLLILIGLDLLLHSLTVDLLTISFSVFWLYTRISLSSWDHEKICCSCGSSCEFTT